MIIENQQIFSESMLIKLNFFEFLIYPLVVRYIFVDHFYSIFLEFLLFWPPTPKFISNLISKVTTCSKTSILYFVWTIIQKLWFLHNCWPIFDLNNIGMISFSFSADKYRPISWSANHVTLYNVQNRGEQASSPSLSRSQSQKRTEKPEAPKEDQMRKIK